MPPLLLALALAVGAPALKDPPGPEPSLIGQWATTDIRINGSDARPGNEDLAYEFTADGRWLSFRGGKDRSGKETYAVDPKVYRANEAKSKSGVFVRIDDGILKKVDEKHAAGRRDDRGRLTADSLKVFQDASEKEVGPWYAVHHGYEVQICDAAEGKRSRPGAVYSLSESAALPDKKPDAWKVMVFTLQADRVQVDIDGKRVTAFDPTGKDVPADRQWYEPKREPKRRAAGYVGLKTHDPGDVVYFKEVEVRPLPRDK
jgi:hypothetical protein